ALPSAEANERLRGPSARFASLGMTKIWPLLFPHLFVERDVFVARRAESIEHARLLGSFDSVRNIAREIIGVARAQFVRPAIREDFHPSREDMDDLFLRMFVLRHFAAGLQLGDHLIHGRAMRDGATPDTRREFDPRFLRCGFAHTALSNLARSTGSPDGATVTARDASIFDISTRR